MVEDFIFYDQFDDMFVAKYKAFFIDDEPQHDVFEFGNLCSTSECLIAFSVDSDYLATSLDLKPLLETLKYSLLEPIKPLPVIIASG